MSEHGATNGSDGPSQYPSPVIFYIFSQIAESDHLIFADPTCAALWILVSCRPPQLSFLSPYFCILTKQPRCCILNLPQLFKQLLLQHGFRYVSLAFRQHWSQRPNGAAFKIVMKADSQVTEEDEAAVVEAVDEAALAATEEDEAVDEVALAVTVEVEVVDEVASVVTEEVVVSCAVTLEEWSMARSIGNDIYRTSREDEHR